MILHARRRRTAGLIATSAILFLAAGCGARLTKAQEAALANSSGSGAGAAAGAGTGSGAETATTAAANAAGATAAGAATGGSNGNHTAAGPARTTPAGQSGPAPVTGSTSPLAGPGGRLCPPGAAGSGPGVTASTVTIGNISTINGPVPGLFAGARSGTQAFAAYANSLGGICGRKLVVAAADDQFDQASDQSEAQSLAGQVLAFVGSFSLQDAGIPGGAPGVPDVGQTLSSARFSSATNFAPQPQPPGFTTGAYQYFGQAPATKSGTQHLAILIENTPQTETNGKWEEDALKSVGYNFIFTDPNIQPTDPTFNNDVQKMKNQGVTGVVFQATAAIVGQLANAMYQAGMQINFGNYVTTAYDPAFLAAAGPGAQGTVLEQQLALYQGEDAAAIPMVATFDQWYSRVNPGKTPDLYAAYGWISGLLFAQGLNAGGALTRPALLAGLKQITSFDGGGMSATSNP
ncbi:MAG: ABC transporter substrate-binding protein, partial [Acidimicrobiales bacterium]